MGFEKLKAGIYRVVQKMLARLRELATYATGLCLSEFLLGVTSRLVGEGGDADSTGKYFT